MSNLRGSGQLDAAGANLLYDAVRTAASIGSFPPPEDHNSWDRDAVLTVAHDFLTGQGAVERLTNLAALADGDESFRRLLVTAVRNFLRSRARQSVLGKQMRRIRAVAEAEESLQVLHDASGPLVAAAEGPTIRFSGDDNALLRIAAKVGPQTRRRWRPDARREGPIADRAEIVSMLREIVAAAGGAVPISELARVLARRFDLAALPATVDMDTLDARPARGFEEVELSDQARALLDQLTERERLVLPFLDDSSRDVAARVDLGHSTVAKVQARLRSLLQEVLPAGDEGAQLLRMVRDTLDSTQ